MSEHLMQLSTKVAPAKTFTVDDAPYELLGMDHLSPEAEAYVTATFSRYGAIAEQLEKTTDEGNGTKMALEMRTLRLNVLGKMTTCPRDVLEQIPMSGQIQMMNALRDEVESIVPEEDDASNGDNE